MPGTGTSDDKPQQQQPPKNSTYSDSLYPHQNIWGNDKKYVNGHARGPSLSSKSKNPPSHHARTLTNIKSTLDVADSAAASGSTANAAPGDNWYPWKDPTRPTSTSPNRTRDSGLPKASTFGQTNDNHVMKNGFNGVNGVNGVNGGGLYGPAYPSQKRNSNNEPSSYFDAVGTSTYPQSRDPSAPPSRHSQGSPAYQELSNGRGHSHAHSSSIHSQRQMGNNPGSTLQSYQNAQRSLNLNKQIDDELAMGMAHRLTLDNSIGKNPLYDPALQPFQLNPGSQPFMDTNGYGLSYQHGTEAQHDPLSSQYSSFKRGSIDRMSPGPSSYRLEAGHSPRNYQPPAEVWNSRGTSRDPRTADLERRAAQQMNLSQYQNQFYPYGYGNVQIPPFSANYGEPMRHQMLPNYSIPQIPGGYYSGSLPPVQPAAHHDAMQGVRSSVLEDFRSNNKTSKRFELKDIYNFIVEFSGDQHGSRFIQLKLETANSDEKDQVFREVEPNAVQLMKDVFGNYVVQKFFEHGNQVQKKILGEKMRGKMVELSMQVYACRVVQKVSFNTPCTDVIMLANIGAF